MNTPDERNDEQQVELDALDPESPTETSVTDATERPGDAAEIDVVDVELGPGAIAPTASAAGDPTTEFVATDTPSSDAVEMFSAIPEPVEPASVATLPILDEEGNYPATLDKVATGLELWEEAAAEVPGDPLFTPRPTTKPREDLLEIRREPWRLPVWLDRATMTPVLYEEQPALPPLASQRTEASPTSSPSQDAAEAQRELGSSRTPLLVTISRAYKHYADALDERMPLFEARAREIARQEIEHEQWVQYCQDRAIFGPH